MRLFGTRLMAAKPAGPVEDVLGGRWRLPDEREENAPHLRHRQWQQGRKPRASPHRPRLPLPVALLPFLPLPSRLGLLRVQAYDGEIGQRSSPRICALEQRKEQRLADIGNETREIALHLRFQGIRLTEKRIHQCLAQPGNCRDPRVRELTRQVNSKLESGDSSLAPIPLAA